MASIEDRVEPLRWPIDPKKLSGIDAFLMWTPLVGKQVKILKGIKDQLTQRKGVLKKQALQKVWKDKFTIAIDVTKIINDNMGWPTGYYIPDDPMDLLLWSHNDGLDHEFCLQELSSYFEKDLSSLKELENMTLGDFVDVATGE